MSRKLILKLLAVSLAIGIPMVSLGTEKLEQRLAYDQVNYTQNKNSDLNQIRLDGIPLSCRFDQVDLIRDRLERPYELLNIAEAYSKSERFEQALTVISRIEEEFENVKLAALVEVARSYARVKQYNKALEVARSLNSSNKSEVLSSVVSELLKEDKSEQALLLGGSIEEQSAKTRSLLEVAKFFMQKGSKDRANAITSETLNLAYSIEGNSNPSRVRKFQALLSIVKFYTEVGQHEQAVEVAGKISDSSFRAIALAQIGSTYVETGQNDEAEELLSKAINLSQSLESKPFNESSTILSNIAVIYAAKGLYSQVLQVIGAMENDKRKVDTLVNVSTEFRRIKLHQKADESLSTAFKVAESLNSSTLKTLALVDVANGYQAAGRTEAANSLLDQAFQISRKIEANESKTTIMNKIFYSYTTVREYSKALQVARAVENAPERYRLTRLLKCALLSK